MSRGALAAGPPPRVAARAYPATEVNTMGTHILPALALLGSLSGQTPGAPEPGEPRYVARYAVVVGISKYDHNDGVPYAVDDAVALSAVLADRFGFTVHLLIDDKPMVRLPPLVQST